MVLVGQYSMTDSYESIGDLLASSNGDFSHLSVLNSTRKLLETLYPAGSLSTKLSSPSTADSNDEENAIVKEDEALDENMEDLQEESNPYSNLVRANNLGDLIRCALEDIYNFKNRDYNAVRSQRTANNTGREYRFLELQREKLMSKEFSEVSEESASPSNGKLQDEKTLQRSLCSLRILTPILSRMLEHDSRRDKSLKFGTITLNSKNKKSSEMCWLLGDVVFDRVSKKFCNSLGRLLRELYVFFGIRLPNIGAKLCDSIPSNLESLFSGASKGPPGWPDHHPLYDLDEADRNKLASITARLDLQFVRSKDHHDDYQRSIQNLRDTLTNLFTKRFADSRVSVYGSCLSDLSLGKNADVDISLHLPSLQRARERFETGRLDVHDYQAERKKAVNQVHKLLRNSAGFSHMIPVTKARVPVVKGTYQKARNPHHPNGWIDFDICFLNDIAVANSELLRQYSMFRNVKSVMIAVKQWAKAHKIGSAQDNYLSSYAWMILVVFYLQRIQYVPNLQNPDLMQACGCAYDSKNEWHNVNKLNTFFLNYEQVRGIWRAPTDDLSVTSLLYGFFRFYSGGLPNALCTVSIKRNEIRWKSCFQKKSFFFCIEDPFETADSHCPHDLGMPVSLPGAVKIMTALQTSETKLRKALLDSLDNEEKLYNVLELICPDDQPSRKKQAREGSNKQQGPKKPSAGPPKVGKESKSSDARKPDQTSNTSDHAEKMDDGNPQPKMNRRGRRKKNAAIKANQPNNNRPKSNEIAKAGSDAQGNNQGQQASDGANLPSKKDGGRRRQRLRRDARNNGPNPSSSQSTNGNVE